MTFGGFRSWWERKVSLTAKMLLLTLLVGGLSWSILERMHGTRISNVFHTFILERQNLHAMEDRLHLDDFLRAQSHAAKVFVHLEGFYRHVEAQGKAWAADPMGKAVAFQVRTKHPPWLPQRFIVRGLAKTRFALLLDGNLRVREAFDAGGARTGDFPWEEVPDHVSLDGDDRLMEAGGMMYLINSGVLMTEGDAQPRAALVFATPLDDAFLFTFQRKSHSQGVLAFVDRDQGAIFASSRPELVPDGASLTELKNDYLIIKDHFFDFGFYGDRFLEIATLTPWSEINGVIAAILQTGRMQKTVSAMVLIVAFALIMFWISRKLGAFTRQIRSFSRERLGVEPERAAQADILHQMVEQFSLMVDELTQARRREEDYTIELEKTNEALQSSLRMVEKTQTQLVEAEKMASLGGMVAGVAHEINTPVGIGVTAASHQEKKRGEMETLFQEGNLRRSELEAYFNNARESNRLILDNLTRTADLIASFREVAVAGHDEPVMTFEPCELLDGLRVVFRERLEAGGHVMTLHCPEEGFRLKTRKQALYRIMENLVDNALIHGFAGRRGGKITCACRSEKGGAALSFTDDGQGMAGPDLARIYEPFFTTRRQEGNGLGMHLVFNLVTHTLGGRIEAESPPGKGLTFKIWIPFFS